MATHKSAEKKHRQSLKRRTRNRRNKSVLKTQIKKMRKAIESKDKEEILKLLPETFSIIDKTVKKGAIHPRTGDRYKSRLSKQVSTIISKPNPK